MSDLSSSDNKMFLFDSKKMSDMPDDQKKKMFLFDSKKMSDMPDDQKKEMFRFGTKKMPDDVEKIDKSFPTRRSRVPYQMFTATAVRMSDLTNRGPEKYEYICRIYQIEVPEPYCSHYSEAVMEFLQIERDIELAIKDNEPLANDYFIQLKSYFDGPIQKGLASFEEEFKLLKVKFIFHFDKCDSRFDECHRILRDVDLDEHDLISRRLNLHRAECSLIKAVIIKRKSGSYSPGSECSKLMEFIAQSKFDVAYRRCATLLRNCPNGGWYYLQAHYRRYLKLLRHHFEADYHSMPYKMKNTNSYKTLDGLMVKAQCNRTKDLIYVMCCIDSYMPGNRKKWLDLLRMLGAITLDHTIYKKGDDEEIFHVSRDRDRRSIDRTALDLMDTTITVIIDDLI